MGGGEQALSARPAGGVCRVPEGGQPPVSRSRWASLASLGALHQPNELLKKETRLERTVEGRLQAGSIFPLLERKFLLPWPLHFLCVFCVCSQRVSAICVVHTCVHCTYTHMHLYINARAHAHTLLLNIKPCLIRDGVQRAA